MNRVIHIDPYSKLADYSLLPKADLVLLTHAHGDHLDPEALKLTVTPKTVVIGPDVCADHPKLTEQLKGRGFLRIHNKEELEIMGIRLKAVPAYNIVHMRKKNVPFHPKGQGNGYILVFSEKKVYIAGDTEDIPEMKNLEAVNIAFLPMNLPYTMTPEMTAAAALSFRPDILYPYHFGETDTEKIKTLLKDSGIDVRIRKMK
jgi:L-ascorbate metabolism protein UlaG (beta-lactamase superfamily)